MPRRKKYVFKIKGGYSVETLPMERLALYLADLAKMLGEPESVHFIDLTEGSAKVGWAVDEDASPVVEDRIERIARGEADVVYMEAYRSLNRRLREDHTEGEIMPEGGATILPFLGASAPPAVEFNGIPKVGHIDGVIIRVGGRREEIHVQVQAENGIFSKCVASKAVAKTLANHIFDDELRLHGTGRWSRGETGQWTLQKFVISHFEVLDPTPLRQVIADVREMGKDAWSGDNLWVAATDIRGKPN